VGGHLGQWSTGHEHRRVFVVAPRHHVPRGRAARTRRPNRAGHGKDRGARGRLPGMSGLSGRSRHGRQDLSHMLPATVWLAIACVVVITALFSVLAAFLVLILRELEAAGGASTSLLGDPPPGPRALPLHTRTAQPADHHGAARDR